MVNNRPLLSQIIIGVKVETTIQAKQATFEDYFVFWKLDRKQLCRLCISTTFSHIISHFTLSFGVVFIIGVINSYHHGLLHPSTR